MNNMNLTIRSLVAMLLVAANSLASAQTLTATRSSSFQYSATTGLLTAETVEPGTPDLCVTTEYKFDSYGNRQVSTVKNCTGATSQALFSTRSTTATFASLTVDVAGVNVQVPAGTFATTVTNAKAQSEQRQYDPRFGTLTAQTGPNGLTTQWQYDDFGRKTLEIAPDGNRVVVRYCVLAGQGDTSANSTGCGSPSGTPQYAISYVETQPQTSVGAISGPYTRKYSDALGRVIREETQGYDGAGQPATARTIVKDTEYNQYGAVAKVTQPYFIETGASVSAGGTAAGWTATEYDALGRPKTIYTRDNEGSSSYAGATAAKAEVTYNGLVVTQTSYRTSKNAQGQQQAVTQLAVVKTSNALGQLVEVKDALNGTLRKRYDPFGNVIETQDAQDNRILTTFDARGRKKQLSDPNAGTWKYFYDALGQLVGQLSPIQSTSASTTMTYDVLGRVTRRVEPEYTTDWTYDDCTKGVGKLCRSVTTNGQTKTYGYDSYGRPSTVSQTTGSTFTATTAYDANGRVSTYTYPTGIALTYTYTSLGYLSEIRRTGNTRVWAMGSANAWGKAETFDLDADSKHNTRNSYDPLTGRTIGIAAGAGDAVMAQTYGWDTVGNLTDRSERYNTTSSSILNENFGYDALNRLASYQTSSPNLSPSISKTVTLTYDLIGNITAKSDVGAYTYASSGPSSVRPGAVQSIAGGAIGNRSYTYDDAGNLKTSTGSKYTTLAYSSFNLPNTLNGAASSYAWVYGADHERVKETKSWNGNSRVTWYFHPDNANGLAFEQEIKNNNTPINRHYVSAMGRTVLMIESNGAVTDSGAMSVKQLQYWHVDQLGSVVTITDRTASIGDRFSYDPFGKRRNPNGTYDAAGNLKYDFDSGDSTDRGFTGHEHLDDVGIVHMNGRTYDPLIGRFMQADPVIAGADNPQAYNRFSYVYNNPLNATDPSGQCPICFVAFYYAITEIAVYAGANIVVASAIAGFTTAMIAGADPNQALRQGAVSGLTAGAFNAVGDGFAKWTAQSPSEVAVRAIAKTAAHAAVGCASSAAGGGKCSDGAIGAGVAEALGPVAGEVGGGKSTQVLVRALIGGIVSRAAGGKFENGAMTAAMGYLFNHCRHNECWTTSEERAFLNRGDFIGYYQEACSGGDSYACKALVVASEDGAWGKVAAVNLSVNAKLAGVNLTDDLKNSVKIDLARGYANLLLNSADQAITPTAEAITKMHWNVFSAHGLPAEAFTATPMGNTSYAAKFWNWLVGPVGQTWGPKWCTGTCKPN